MTEEEILSHLPQCEIIARGVWHHIGRRIPLDDLIQYGRIGLLRAAKKFDESRGFKFKTYAEWKIRGAILDGIRSETKRGDTLIPPLLSLSDPEFSRLPDKTDFRVATERKVLLERMIELTDLEIELVLSIFRT